MRTAPLLLGLIPWLAFAYDAPEVFITATCDGDSVYVDLNWSPVPGASVYKVFYQPRLTDAPELFGQSTVTSFAGAVPTEWSWHGAPDILGFFRVVATDHASVLFPAGSFIMGGFEYSPEHEVTLSHAFTLGGMEVTNLEYMAAAQWALDNGQASVVNGILVAYGQPLLHMTSNWCEITFADGRLALRRAPDAGLMGDFDDWDSYEPDQHPVKGVTWYGAATCCDWLSMIDGLEPYYQGLWNQIPSQRNPYLAEGYRLPTEAEWEYSAQFNNHRTFPWGDAAPACDRTNSRISSTHYCVGWTSPVGTRPTGASGRGLLDMGGNVWEWTNDWFAAYAGNAQLDPVGPNTGTLRTPRGGSWISDAQDSRCVSRLQRLPAESSDYIGFRVCKTEGASR
jgi:formylglycine-generating enzyme required for sulfatase activity